MTTADWIKRRRELLASATDGPWADIASLKDARTSLPLALDALEAVLAVLPEPGSVDMYGVAGALSLDVRDAIETALAVACPRCFLRRSLSGDCGCDS